MLVKGMATDELEIELVFRQVVDYNFDEIVSKIGLL